MYQVIRLITTAKTIHYYCVKTGFFTPELLGTNKKDYEANSYLLDKVKKLNREFKFEQFELIEMEDRK